MIVIGLYNRLRRLSCDFGATAIAVGEGNDIVTCRTMPWGRQMNVSQQIVEVCPSCGNKTTLAVVHREEFRDLIDEAQDGSPIWGDHHRWLLLRCNTCSERSLFGDLWDPENREQGLHVLYPASRRAGPEVPEKIQKWFGEAVLVSRMSPSLAAVGVRRCLEAVVKDQLDGTKKRTLAEGVRELASKGVLPDTLAKMMNTSRIIGNLGAHASDIEVEKADILAIIDFCHAVIEYVYVAPAKIKAVEARLAVRRQTAGPPQGVSSDEPAGA